MKNYMLTFLLGLLMSSTLMADFMRIEMGTGAWQNTAVGEKTYIFDDAIAIDKSLEKENTSSYIWLLLKHPIPVIPNLRLEYTDVSTNGMANGSFEDFEALNSATQLDITQYDVIPYYNFLDNTAWITLDIGLDFKIMQTTYEADNVSEIDLSDTYTTGGTLILPLLYTRVRVQIPGTDIGLETDAKYISYSSTTVYDVRAKIDYTLDFIPIIQPALEVGYRIQKYDLDEPEFDGKINLEFSGVYVGVMIRY